MKIGRFEGIIAWQKAKELTIQIYRMFEEHKDYGFKDQIRRAAVSIMNNIAEDFERKGNKELSHFLYIAKGLMRGGAIDALFSQRMEQNIRKGFRYTLSAINGNFQNTFRSNKNFMNFQLYKLYKLSTL